MGTCAGNWLKLETGTRAIGMGGAHVAVGNGIYAAPYNPASIGFIIGQDSFFSRTNYVAGITIDNGTCYYGSLSDTFSNDCTAHGLCKFGCYEQCLGDIDCTGVCGGNAQYDVDEFCCSPDNIDDCGVCNGGNSSCEDCAGVPNGDAVVDNCGTCDSDASNDCIQDCLGAWCIEGEDGCLVGQGRVEENGTQIGIDVCGICDGDGTYCDWTELIALGGGKRIFLNWESPGNRNDITYRIYHWDIMIDSLISSTEYIHTGLGYSENN